MRTLSGTTWLAAAALALAALPAGAVTNGDPDGDGHPNVAFIVGTLTEDACGSAQRIVGGCSAVLIGPDVLLTSSYCTDSFRDEAPQLGQQAVWVTFDPNDILDCTKYHKVREDGLVTSVGEERGHADIGVVLLEAPVSGVTPASLPVEGRLDALDREQPYTVVAYGRDTSAGPNLDIRRSAAARTATVTEFRHIVSLHVEPGREEASVAGNVGGVAFVGATNEIVSVVDEFGHFAPIGSLARLDVAGARAFLAAYVTLP